MMCTKIDDAMLFVPARFLCLCYCIVVLFLVLVELLSLTLHLGNKHGI